MSANGKEAAAALARILTDAPAWAEGDGPFADTVLSSRIRLARNLADAPFPSRSDREQQGRVVNRFRRTVEEIGDLSAASFLAVHDLEEEAVDVLVERRLVSRDLARSDHVRGVLVGEGESVTVMVNEEDHFRLQNVVSGLDLGAALDRLGELDDLLDRRLDYAWDEEFGYLTACPTNVGTGMRASVLAHLPALVLTKRAKKVIQGVSALGLAVRGFYGEGSEVMGNFFQISNQTTLGRDEHAIVSRLDEVVRQILGYEAEARETMWSTARTLLEDKIYRADATLRSARSIEVDEVVSLASAVRFGIALDLPGLCPLSVLNEVLISSQPGHMRRRAGRELTDDQLRAARADAIRRRLAGEGGEPPARDPGMSEERPSRGEED